MLLLRHETGIESFVIDEDKGMGELKVCGSLVLLLKIKIANL